MGSLVHPNKELFDKYHRQLEVYAKAVAEIMGLPVKEKFIYSFHLGEAIEV